MDLGASVCLPNGKPDCSACPWQNTCRAHETGTETDFPVMPPKAPRRRTRKTVFLITDGERILLRRRPKSGLLAGLFELPNADDLPAAEDAAYTAVLALLNGQKNTGIPGRSHRSGSVLPEPPAPAAALLMPLGPAKHIFTHREWDMTGWAVGADLRKFPLRCTRSGELFAASLPGDSVGIFDSQRLPGLYGAAAGGDGGGSLPEAPLLPMTPGRADFCGGKPMLQRTALPFPLSAHCIQKYTFFRGNEELQLVHTNSLQQRGKYEFYHNVYSGSAPDYLADCGHECFENTGVEGLPDRFGAHLGGGTDLLEAAPSSHCHGSGRRRCECPLADYHRYSGRPLRV